MSDWVQVRGVHLFVHDGELHAIALGAPRPDQIEMLAGLGAAGCKTARCPTEDHLTRQLRAWNVPLRLHAVAA